MRRKSTAFRRDQSEMRSFARVGERHQVARAVACGHGFGNIDERLRLLSYRNCRENFVTECVDRNNRILILESDVNTRSIARSPDAVGKSPVLIVEINSGLSPRR